MTPRSCLLWLQILACELHWLEGFAQTPRYCENFEMNWGVNLRFQPGQQPSTSLNTPFDDFFQVTMSDPLTGEILFVTDRDGVRDRFGDLMPNGGDFLFDFNLIVAAIPHPGNDDLFYVFSTEDTGPVNEQPIEYSIVDMSLNNGLGDVTVKRIPFAEPSLWPVTAISQPDGAGYWFITHPTFGNEFHCYHITSGSGLDTVPVVRTIGPSTGPCFPFIPTMSVSPGNDRLAFLWSSDPGQGQFAGDRIWVFDIDPTDLTFSDPTVFEAAYDGAHRALALSANGSVLYASIISGAAGIPEIVQYDLSSGVPSVITATAYGIHVPTADTNVFSYLRLMPDSMIYGTGAIPPWRSKLVRIHEPDAIGADCNLDPVGLETGAVIPGPLELPWSFWPYKNTVSIADLGTDHGQLVASTAGNDECLFWLRGIMPYTNGRIELFDARGAKALSAAWPNGTTNLKLGIRHLSAGVYLAELRFGTDRLVTRVSLP